MANFLATKITGECAASRINNSLGVKAIDLDALDENCRALRQIETHVDTGIYAVGTGWTLTGQFPAMNNCKAGSLILMTYYFPNRNDSTSWGGMYHEPQYNVGDGWISLGSCGYDGGVMNLSHQTIASYSNSILIDPGPIGDFSIQFRFFSRSYDGTTTINGSHDINNISGTAPLMSGANSNQHHFHIIVEEYGRLTGEDY